MHETLQAHLSYKLLTDVCRCYRWCMLTKSSSIRQNETSRSNSLKTCHCKWLHAVNVWWALATLPFHFSQGVIIFLQWPIMTMFRCRARNAVIWTCPMRRGCSFKQPPEASNSCRGWYVWKRRPFDHLSRRWHTRTCSENSVSWGWREITYRICSWSSFLKSI